MAGFAIDLGQKLLTACDVVTIYDLEILNGFVITYRDFCPLFSGR